MDGPAGAKALSIAAGKINLSLSQAFFRGILCKWLVVLAVWLSMVATDVIGKIGAKYFPIMAFVALDFEHSIANMYFMMLGILLKGQTSVVAASGVSDAALSAVGAGGYLHNLIPVTLGNMVGGILFVAVFYFYIFRDKVEGLQL